MKIAKKLKGMVAMAMAAITLATTVSSCSKDKGATPAQKTTETKKGLGIQVSAVSAAGGITVKVSGYDAKQHAEVKIEASLGDDWATLAAAVTVDGNKVYGITGLDPKLAYKVRLSYTIPGGGTGQTRLTTAPINVRRELATAVITGITGVSNEDGQVVLTISGTNLEKLVLDKAGIQSKVQNATFGALPDNVTVTSLEALADQDGDGMTSREVTISGLANGKAFLFKITNVETASSVTSAGAVVPLSVEESQN